MKKHSFIENTIISTICIILVKIMGMLYVIPFVAIVGSSGAALYAYAYNIYGLFLEISTAGIPNAIGKLVNEYNTLGKHEAKLRTFKIGKVLLSVIAGIAFLVMFFFARPIAELILGDIKGGNTIQDVAFVIRAVSFALLIFPFLSVTRGFFQGHGIIYISSFSQVIEQFVRVFIIIVGSYLAIYIFNISTTGAVGVAVFSAFVAGASALIYVQYKLRKNKKELKLNEKLKKDKVSNKEIIKAILRYAIPTIIISIAFSIYNNIDMILILRTMDYLKFSGSEAEFISTAISTWAPKISIIITSIGLGMAPGLVAEMVRASTLKKYEEVNHKFNKALEIMLFVTIPMCIGISLLSKPIWLVFYGSEYSTLGFSILAVCIFSPLFSNLFTIANYTLQSLNRFKMVYISAISGIVINALLDVPLMILFAKVGIPAYHGATVATIIGFSFTFGVALVFLKKAYNFKYKEIINLLKKILIPLSAMIIVVVLLKYLLPINLTTRFNSVLYIGIVSIVGAGVYFYIASKINLLQEVMGEHFLDKIKNKFRRKKKEA